MSIEEFFIVFCLGVIVGATIMGFVLDKITKNLIKKHLGGNNDPIL